MARANTSVVGDYLNPSRGVRDDARRRGLPVRDHHADNVRRLAEIQEAVSAAKDMEAALTSQPKFTLRKFADVPARVTAHMRRDDSEEENEPARPAVAIKEFMHRRPAPPPESIIPARYVRPEAVPRKPAVPKATEVAVAKTAPSTPPKNHLAENVRAVVVPAEATGAHPASRSRAARPADSADGKRTDYGEVPKYLKERQAEWAAAAAAKKKAEEEADVPHGMRLMPEAERLETLALVKSGIEETQAALLKFKLRVDVPSQVRRKAELEAKLVQLEEAQRVFSRSRVFVKLDA